MKVLYLYTLLINIYVPFIAMQKNSELTHSREHFKLYQQQSPSLGQEDPTHATCPAPYLPKHVFQNVDRSNTNTSHLPIEDIELLVNNNFVEKRLLELQKQFNAQEVFANAFVLLRSHLSQNKRDFEVTFALQEDLALLETAQRNLVSGTKKAFLGQQTEIEKAKNNIAKIMAAQIAASLHRASCLANTSGQDSPDFTFEADIIETLLYNSIDKR